MISFRLFCYLPILGLVMLAGCGQQSHIKELSRKTWIPKTASWAELQALWHTDNYQDYTLEKFERSQGFGAKQGLTSASFQERLKKFDETPIPAEYATPERDAAKKEMVAALKRAIDAANRGNTAELHKQSREIAKFNSEILKVPGQTPPEGSAAQQFAPAYVPTQNDVNRAKNGQKM
jgi:hypothetical protein